MKRWWKAVVLAVPVIYGGFLAATFAAMHQPPEKFARYMSALPGPAMMLLPFRPLWSSARAGALSVGDAAPEFEAATVDKQSRIRWSEFRAGRPVLMVFGSYT